MICVLCKDKLPEHRDDLFCYDCRAKKMKVRRQTRDPIEPNAVPAIFSWQKHGEDSLRARF